jgi:hypothetical protein
MWRGDNSFNLGRIQFSFVFLERLQVHGRWILLMDVDCDKSCCLSCCRPQPARRTTKRNSGSFRRPVTKPAGESCWSSKAVDRCTRIQEYQYNIRIQPRGQLLMNIGTSFEKIFGEKAMINTVIHPENSNPQAADAVGWN